MGDFKVEGGGKVTRTPGRLCGGETAAASCWAQTFATALCQGHGALLLCWRDSITLSLSPGSALIAPRVVER